MEVTRGVGEVLLGRRQRGEGRERAKVKIFLPSALCPLPLQSSYSSGGILNVQYFTIEESVSFHSEWRAGFLKIPWKVGPLPLATTFSIVEVVKKI